MVHRVNIEAVSQTVEILPFEAVRYHTWVMALGVYPSRRTHLKTAKLEELSQSKSTSKILE